MRAEAELGCKTGRRAGGGGSRGSQAAGQGQRRLQQLAWRALGEGRSRSSPLVRERALLYLHLLQGEAQQLVAQLVNTTCNTVSACG